MSDKGVSHIITAVHNWCQTHPIQLCILFGSQATGHTHSASDIDLAVWPSELPDSGTKLRWLVELQNLLDKEVSLVLVSPDLDPVLGMEIVRNGRVVFSIDPNSWSRERIRLWHAYNDSLPFRRAAREQLRQFAEGISDDQ